MTLMRVAAANGYVLTYDTDDVEDIEISTPADHREVGVTPRGAIKRELTGDHHLTLRIDFKHGKKALWVDQAEAALPDLRSGGDFLMQALVAEGVDADHACRIFNRFFFGVPDGPNAAPRQFDQDPVDCPARVDISTMRHPEPQFIHGNRCYDAAPRVRQPEADDA